MADMAGIVRDMTDGLEVDLVMTPEMTPLLQNDRDKLEASVQNEALTISPYQEIARANGCHFLLGSAAIRIDPERIVNRSVMISPDGDIIARYDKINLFEADLPNGETYMESDTYTAGTARQTARIGDFKFGLSICYDLRFPDLYSRYAEDEVDAITMPAAFLASTGKAHWEVLLRARAIESGAWVLAPAQGGHHADGRDTWGRTLAVSPWGEVVGCLDHNEPGVLTVEIDKNAVKEARAHIPAWRQRDRGR